MKHSDPTLPSRFPTFGSFEPCLLLPITEEHFLPHVGIFTDLRFIAIASVPLLQQTPFSLVIMFPEISYLFQICVFYLIPTLKENYSPLYTQYTNVNQI